MERIVIDSSNIKEYELVDKNGTSLGVIALDTTDIAIADRADKAYEKIKGILQEFSDDADMGKLAEVDTKLRQEVNNIFNSDVCTAAFGKQHCMNVKNGKTLIERFMDAILPVIQKEIKRESNMIQNRVNKYTAPYQKNGNYGQKRRKKR